MAKTYQSMILAVFVLFGANFSPQPVQAGSSCDQVHIANLNQTSSAKILADRRSALPARSEATQALAKFAEENKLPYRWIELGPAERRVSRLFVGLDSENPALLKKYLETFNLDTAVGKDAGTLALEFAKESIATPEHYITGVLRTSADPSQPIYRWGKKDLPRDSWWNTWILGTSYVAENQTTGVLGFAHLFGLSKAEKDNVQHFLDNPEARGPCKSDNCVAWTSGIELGTTKKESTDEDRRYLFNELGVGRSMAHFEIGRRLMHAANENHTAVVVFLKGDVGSKTFNQEIDKFLVPEPKIPYFSIIRGVDVAPSKGALDAISQIADGAKIFIPIAAGASPEGVASLIHTSGKQAKGWDVHILVNGISAASLKKGVESTDGKFRLHALFLGGNVRQLYAEKKLSVIPGNLSDFTRLMKDPANTHFHYDAIIVRVAPSVDGGRTHSLGPNSDMIMTILRNRPDIQIIAEINPAIPVTTGENFIPSERITARFESRAELAGPAVVPPNAIDSKIGHHLGKLVNSGATLQLGIGNIFSGLPEGLRAHGRENLSISTEMFGDPMKQMMQMGIVTNAETGFAYGSKDLYRWLNRNRNVRFVETEYVNNPGRIASIDNFHAVNTALQVNLYGESNATMGPEGRISSPGGQVEFMTGAARSQGGKAIIAIRSTAKNETLSTIVLDFYRGPITTPHESVTHVVTEYGIAELRGKSENQRAVALISVAHPKFRESLIQQAQERGLISFAEAASIPRD
jgi:acyl-CoA hydrolase